jgi:nitrogen fixation NifU-like protein
MPPPVPGPITAWLSRWRSGEHDALEHDARPRNFRVIDGVQPVERHIPLCGDHLAFYLRTDDGVVSDASFQGVGCAISKASASLLSESVRGRSIADAISLCAALRRLLTAAPDAPVEDLGPLSALSGVRQFAARVECACLSLDAFLQILERG